MSFPISSCLYSSLFILSGNSSRNISISVRDVEAELPELEDGELPEKNRSEGRRISGAGEVEECRDEAIGLCAPRVGRKEEESLEVWR